jgi:hypothetical protein
VSSVPFHGRDHRIGGADPIPGLGAGGGGGAPTTLPRARVWSTFALPVFTVTDTTGFVFPWNHGATTDEETFEIQSATIFGVPTGANPILRIRIWRGGIYAITWRFIPESSPDGDIDDAEALVTAWDVAPDYWDSIYIHAHGYGLNHSYVTTIVDHEDYVPTSVNARLDMETGSPSLTFGRTDWQTAHPDRNTGSFLEVVRLGSAETQDWFDWWSDTPADVAGPTTTPGLLAARPEEEEDGPRRRGRAP